MTLLSIERRPEPTSELRNSGLLLSLKPSGWTLWHHSNEEGMRVIQIGPLVLEIWG